MPNIYRVRYKNSEVEIEVESSDKSYVDSKLSELLGQDAKSPVKPKRKPAPRKPANKTPAEGKAEESSVDIPAVVNAINESDDHAKIDENILSKTSQLGRIMLCFYYANKALESPLLTSGDIEIITNQLGVRIAVQNAGGTIKKNQKYFTTDRVRKMGAIIKYKLNRKGISAFEKLLQGEKLS